MKASNAEKKQEFPPLQEMARSAMEQGNFESAEALFSQMIEDKIQPDEAWLGLAQIHRSNSEKELSRACLLRGLDENPYNKTALLKLCDWGVQDGVEVRKALIEKYLSRFPEDKDLLTGKN